MQAGRQLRTVPLPVSLQLHGQLVIDDCVQAQSGQEPLDAVGHCGTLGLQFDQLPVQLPLILLRDGWDMNEFPDLELTVVPTDEHLNEFHCVEAVDLALLRRRLTSMLEESTTWF